MWFAAEDLRDPPYWGDLRGELTARGLRVRAVGLAGGICHSSGGGEQAAIGEVEWAIHGLVIENSKQNITEAIGRKVIRKTQSDGKSIGTKLRRNSEMNVRRKQTECTQNCKCIITQVYIAW